MSVSIVRFRQRESCICSRSSPTPACTRTYLHTPHVGWFAPENIRFTSTLRSDPSMGKCHNRQRTWRVWHLIERHYWRDDRGTDHDRSSSREHSSICTKREQYQ